MEQINLNLGTLWSLHRSKIAVWKKEAGVADNVEPIQLH
jgi:hypothetical protein